MLIISFIFGIGGLFVDPIYALDWWNALTLTGTMPGIESFLFGFGTAGIASVIFMEVFNKKIKIEKRSKKQKEYSNKKLLSIILSVALLFFGSFFLLGTNSFQASFPALLIPTFVIWFNRKDLIWNSIVSGFLLMMISFTFYLIPELFNPGWLATAWNFEILSGITILGVVVEDLVWFFMIGMLIGPLYGYSQEAKLIKNKK